MHRRNLGRRVLAVIVLACALGIMLGAVARAQPSTESAAPALVWSSIDGGGVTNATSGSLELGSTVGQFDTSVLASGALNLLEGFWSAGGFRFPVYLPAVFR